LRRLKKPSLHHNYVVVGVGSRLGKSSWLVSSFPHDLLKPFDWRRHDDTRILPKDVQLLLGKYIVKSFNTATKKVEDCTLKKVIEEHHSMKSRGLAQPWSLGDKLSSAIARLRCEYDYWLGVEGAEPFLVKVYGEVERWGAEKVKRLKEDILTILREYAAGEASRQPEGLAKINELLSRFPSDSRFPFVSLKTHHWMTDVLRRSRCLNEILAKGEDVDEVKMYLVRISVAEPEFHRLKELRGFIQRLREAYGRLEKALFGKETLMIGDDAYLVTACEDEVNEIIAKLSKVGYGFNVDVFEWLLKRRTLSRGERVYVVEKEVFKPLTVGGFEEFGFKVEGYKAWAYLLEGGYRYLLWASIRPRGGIEEAAKEFLNWAEGFLAGFMRKPCEDVIRQDISLSPELLISIADGFNDFISECESSFNGYVIARSFSRTLFIRGLTDPSDAVGIYCRLIGLKRKLHIPAYVTFVVCGPKYPFWRVLELFRGLEDRGGGLVFELGEKLVKLDDRHAELVNRVRVFLRGERKQQLYRIVNAACRDNKEVLKVKIRGLAEQDKISQECAEKLCWLVDEVARMHRDEEERREVTCEMFKILRMFTGGKGSRV
jgi:hypothetical protein